MICLAVGYLFSVAFLSVLGMFGGGVEGLKGMCLRMA